MYKVEQLTHGPPVLTGKYLKMLRSLQYLTLYESGVIVL